MSVHRMDLSPIDPSGRDPLLSRYCEGQRVSAISVVIAEQQKSLRTAYIKQLRPENGIAVVGEAGTGHEVVKALVKERIRVAQLAQEGSNRANGLEVHGALTGSADFAQFPDRQVLAADRDERQQFAQQRLRGYVARRPAEVALHRVRKMVRRKVATGFDRV